MSTAAFVVMPQWQGSASSRAMRLVEGAAALREDLPASRLEVDVPLEAGDAMGTAAARLSSVLRARDAALDLLAGVAGPTITLGGDCASTLAGLQFAVQRHGAEKLAVLWFDAHAGLQHPSTSPSGAISGMALRHALGDGVDDLVFPEPVREDLLTLIGQRLADTEEEIELQRRNIARLEHLSAETGPTAVEAFASEVEERLRFAAAAGATHVYVHIDLDVLDPAEFTAVHNPVPFGLTAAQLVGAVRAAVAVLPLAAAAVCEFAPSDEAAAREDLPTILRLLAALTSSPRGEA